MKRTIFLDLDDTLLSSDKKITEKTLNYLLKIQKENVARLVLISGRTIPFILPLSKLLHLEKYDGYIIANNGATLYSCRKEKELYSHELSIDEVRDILEHLKEFDVLPMVHLDGVLYVQKSPRLVKFNDMREIDIVKHEAESTCSKVVIDLTLSEWLDANVIKILAAGDFDYLLEHESNIVSSFTASITGPVALEFTSSGVNKATSIEYLKDKLNIDFKDMIAFGDGKNDIPMFEIVGLSVAMENAATELKKVADRVTKSNEEDGIVYFLKEYFDNIKT